MKGLNSGSKFLNNSDLFLNGKETYLRKIIEEEDEEEFVPERLIIADDLRNTGEFVWHPKRKF